jgi:uncharacterized membrane protein YfcA
MATISLILHPRKTEALDFRITISLALGGVIGGVAGKTLFSFLKELLGNERFVGAVQSIVMVIALCFVMLFFIRKAKIKPLYSKNMVVSLFLGIFMGTVGSFIGISGGPINLVILYVFFGMDSKKSAINSLLIIFLAHGSNLLFSLITNSIPVFDPSSIVVLVLGGLSGGFLGSAVSKYFKNKSVDFLSVAALSWIMILGVINAIRWLH